VEGGLGGRVAGRKGRAKVFDVLVNRQMSTTTLSNASEIEGNPGAWGVTEVRCWKTGKILALAMLSQALGN